MVDVMMAGLPIIDPSPIGPINTGGTDSRRLAFRTLDGEDLWPFKGKEFIARKGITGLDLVPTEVVQSTVPGMDGVRIEEVKRGAREVYLPIYLGSDVSQDIYFDRRDRLARLFNDRVVAVQNTHGTFDLVATSDRGERSLRVMYVSGMEGDTSADASGTYWESLGLNLLAARPYWHGEPWTTPTIRRARPVQWFPDFPGRLSSSRALGYDIPVSVSGDVTSWPTAHLVGPADSVTISSKHGLMISIPSGLVEGESAVITTDPRDRDAVFGGVRDWARIGPGDRYAPLDPGDELIDVIMPGADDETSARITGATSYERAW